MNLAPCVHCNLPKHHIVLMAKVRMKSETFHYVPIPALCQKWQYVFTLHYSMCLHYMQWHLICYTTCHWIILTPLCHKASRSPERFSDLSFNKNHLRIQMSMKSALRKHFSGLYTIPERQGEKQQGYSERCLPQLITRKCTQVKGEKKNK